MRSLMPCAAFVCVAACGTTVSPVALQSQVPQPGLDATTRSVASPLTTAPTAGHDVTAPPRVNSAGAIPSATSAASLPHSVVRRGEVVYLGVMTEKDASRAAGALGVSGLSFGDTEAQIRAILADLNRRGGLLGHRVEPVFHDVKTSDAQSNPANAAQAACQDWTQDHHVVAAINSVAALNNDALYGCMARAGVPLFIGDLGPHANGTFARYSTSLFGVGILSSERIAATLVPRLVAQRYFTGWDTRLGAPGSAPVKVGIVHVEQYPAYKDVLVQQLTAHGVTSIERFGYDLDVATLPSQMASAELQFASHGVTHVLIEEASAALFFLPTAEQQRYRPRYGIQSLDALSTLSSALPEAQFAGAMGIGWSQYSDVTAANDPGDPSPATAPCRRLMQSAGDDPSNRTGMLLMGIECDAVALLARAAAVSDDLDPAALRRGLEAIGTSARSTFTFGLRYAPDRHDGASTVRDVQWTGNGFAFSGPRTTT